MSNDIKRITSFQNPRIKLIKTLRDKRGREREGRFVIDNERDLARALDCGYEVDFVLYTPQHQPVLPNLPAHALYEVTPDILEKASYRDNPSALVAVMVSRPLLRLADLNPTQQTLLLVLVGLEKPGNIGALLRTADAVGVDAILCVDQALDLFNPNIIRASTGASFLNNIYTANSADTIQFLHEQGYRIAATVVDGDTDLFNADFSGRVAFVMGTEDVGLSSDWVNASDQRLTIPMIGQVSDSLNVSVSGAICLYEAFRQRRI
jgi:TrmH family RNA methyltransferase